MGVGGKGVWGEERRRGERGVEESNPRHRPKACSSCPRLAPLPYLRCDELREGREREGGGGGRGEGGMAGGRGLESGGGLGK